MRPMKLNHPIVFDSSPYTRAPIFSLSEGITLSKSLLAAQPKGMPAIVGRASARLEQRTDEAQAALLDRQREDGQLSEEDNKALDQMTDATFGGLRMRIDGYACLPPDATDKAARALTLRTTLFGNEGMAFLNESYASQWTIMDTMVKRIDQDKLAPEIDALCGPEFLAHIRKLMPRYERMVKSMMNRETNSGQNLFDERNRLARAIVAYSTAVCATVDEEDPKTIERALLALRPLDIQRSSAAARRAAPAEAPPAAPADIPPSP